MKMFIQLLLFTCLLSNSFAEEKTLAEKEGELLDFNSIKQILKNDGLDSSANKKQKVIFQAKTERIERTTRMFDIPSKDDMFGFITELWLVKNAPILKWDFQKPDYGLDISFAQFLEKMGIYEQRFKILLLNGPNISHFALPGFKGEIIFLVSQPFIRTLDLSKLEISLLLYEDFLRFQAGYFLEKIEDKELSTRMGGNFEKNKFDRKLIDKILQRYDSATLDKGFNFNQQYAITVKLGDILKSDMKLWNSYVNLIKKIDDLVKSNLMYSKYNEIYPSPELQLGWLLPKKSFR